MNRGSAAAGATLLAVALGGCSAASGSSRPAPAAAPVTATATRVSAAPPAPTAATPPRRPDAAAPARPAVMRLRIPAIGLRSLRVVSYRGHADDLPGTRIQDRGRAASPSGTRGGVAPGEVGNLIITAHRTTAGGPFGRLPSLAHGEHVLVVSGGTVYDYEVTDTMRISFRSKRSLARQSAAVPGHPGRTPTRAMITLSTCATPEDHARGNYWSDALGNPEHRINKVGVLVTVRPA